MRQGLVTALVAGLALVMIPSVDAEAKRLGGSRSSGVQRQTPTQPVQKAQPDAAPSAAPGAAPGAAVPAAAAAATAAKAAPAAAQAAKRSWMGPLMGLAAGLGLAALFSSLGMGETFSSIMMILLMAMVGFFLFRFIMGRFAAGRGGPKLAGAAAGAGLAGMGTAKVEPSFNSGATTRSTVEPAAADGVRIGSALTPPMAVSGLNDAGTAVAEVSNARLLPADFDTQAFERAAKMIFIRLQAANDERNLDDLRAFTTPEMFAELRTDILDRSQADQSTEVVSVNPTIVDFEDEGAQQVVSVRYVGVIREDSTRPADSFDEIWHLVKKPDSPAWRIAGIQQAN